MSTAKRISILCSQSLIVLVAMASSAFAAPPEFSASIQATARVEASLGFTNAEIIRGDRSDLIVPGSHLYWLYYPRQEGVLLQLSRASSTVVPPNDLPEAGDVRTVVPKVLQEYSQVSLVDLFETVGVGDERDSTSVTLTLIFTNN